MSAQTACDRCAGCGQIATDDEGTPWKYWADLPAPSNLSVVMGLVKPLPCPECGGSGFIGGTTTNIDQQLSALRADITRLSELVAGILGVEAAEMMRRG